VHGRRGASSILRKSYALADVDEKGRERAPGALAVCSG